MTLKTSYKVDYLYTMICTKRRAHLFVPLTLCKDDPLRVTIKIHEMLEKVVGRIPIPIAIPTEFNPVFNATNKNRQAVALLSISTVT